MNPDKVKLQTPRETPRKLTQNLTRLKTMRQEPPKKHGNIPLQEPTQRTVSMLGAVWGRRKMAGSLRARPTMKIHGECLTDSREGELPSVRHSRFASTEAFPQARWRKPPCKSCAYIFCNLCTSCTPGIFRSPAMICSRCLRSEMSSTISTLAWLFAVCAPMLRMLL